MIVIFISVCGPCSSPPHTREMLWIKPTCKIVFEELHCWECCWFLSIPIFIHAPSCLAWLTSLWSYSSFAFWPGKSRPFFFTSSPSMSLFSIYFLLWWHLLLHLSYPGLRSAICYHTSSTSLQVPWTGSLSGFINFFCLLLVIEDTSQVTANSRHIISNNIFPVYRTCSALPIWTLKYCVLLVYSLLLQLP